MPYDAAKFEPIKAPVMERLKELCEAYAQIHAAQQELIQPAQRAASARDPLLHQQNLVLMHTLREQSSDVSENIGFLQQGLVKLAQSCGATAHEAEEMARLLLLEARKQAEITPSHAVVVGK